ncbi:MAG: hypothetical protein IMX02_06560 [Limnochordaceae bacterium]|nr:hypothetical protein [Limnochordaceae bacterium]
MRGRSLAWLGLIVTLIAAPVVAAAATGQRAGAPEPATAASKASQSAPAPGGYTDVTDAALRRALQALEPTGALTAFPGDHFRASRAITLGEFARAGVATFDMTLPAGASPERAAVQALMERGILPKVTDLADAASTPLSVGNLLTAAVRLAGMGSLAGQWPAPNGGDPSGAAMELARAAGMVPASIRSASEARRAATRGEAVQVLYLARQLSTASGRLQLSQANARRATVTTDGGPVPLRFSDATLVMRNGQPSSVERLATGDQVTAVLDPAGEAKVVVASGGSILDQQVALEKARDLLRQVAQYLTPQQWQMLLQGDWKGLTTTLTPEVYDRLMALGIAPWEAEALINRDWASLRQVAMDRLAQEGATRLNVSPELIRSVLAQDWTSARQLAQQELLEKVINQLILPNAGGSTTAPTVPPPSNPPAPPPAGAVPQTPTAPAAPASPGGPPA